MTTIRVYSPGNEYTKNNRFYNYFWDEFTEYLKKKFIVEEHRYYEGAHRERWRFALSGGISENFELLECEYLIQNTTSNEFVIISVADNISSAVINEQRNPLLKKVLLAQYFPKDVHDCITDEIYKYSPWTYFLSAAKFDVEQYYQKRLVTPPIDNRLYFRGTSLPDRPILNYINKRIITDFTKTVDMNTYFNELIKHKIGLSVDGRGEFCYRDIECFAVGVPIIRFEYVSKMYNALIPNYHYISIPRPKDMDLYRTGNEKHATLLEKRYYEVLEDDRFLTFIATNARKYYENNCSIDSLMKNTFELLHLNFWL